MPHLYWYYALIVVGAIMMIYTGYKKRNIPDLISLFIFATGISWISEQLILFVLNAYAYKPGLFADPFAENILGHTVANTALWSSTAILVMTFNLSIPWILLLSIGYMLADEFFLKVGAYQHHWWQTYMTGIGILVFLQAMKIWYRSLCKQRHKVHRLITMWTIAWFLIQTPTGMLTLFGKLSFDVHWFENTYRTSIVFSGLFYDVFMASVIVLFVSIPKKNFWSIIPLFIIVSGDILLKSMNILVFHDGWNLLYLTILRIISLGVFTLCEKYTLRPYMPRSYAKDQHELR